MTRPTERTARGAIGMGLLLGIAIAGLVAVIVGVIGYTTNQEVTGIFDRSAKDSRDLAVENVSRFADLLASNTAVTVRPSVLDHNYSYIRSVLADMTKRDDSLIYIGVFDAEGGLIEDSGTRETGDVLAMHASAPIASQQKSVGKVELLYSMAEVDARIGEAQAENQAQRSSSIRYLIITGAVVLGVGVLIAAGFGVWLSRPVTRMAQATSKLGVGQFDVRVDVGGPTEIRQLARTFNSMAGELQASIQSSIEQAALEREVATARRLQRDMMPPEERIAIGDLEIASWYAPAGKMGGDWWAANESGGDRVTVMVGDVIGHGIPAALFTAAAKSAYRTVGIVGADSGPQQTLAYIDAALRGFSRTHTMSCCAAQFDLTTRELVLSLAAHPAPLRFRSRNGEAVLDVLDGEGPLLGDPIPGAGFTSSTHALEPGDLFVLFTDGIIEATNERGRMFGLRRLGAAIGARLDDDLDALLASLKKTFYGYVKDNEVDDDVTVVVVRYQPQREDRASA
jgi:serine phosphatase RsbU (regulator of sigma subunit)